jgi:hypothetical protein
MVPKAWTISSAIRTPTASPSAPAPDARPLPCRLFRCTRTRKKPPTLPAPPASLTTTAWPLRPISLTDAAFAQGSAFGSLPERIQIDETLSARMQRRQTPRDGPARTVSLEIRKTRRLYALPGAISDTSSTIVPDAPTFHQQQVRLVPRNQLRPKFLNGRHGVYTFYPLSSDIQQYC